MRPLLAGSILLLALACSGPDTVRGTLPSPLLRDSTVTVRTARQVATAYRARSQSDSSVAMTIGIPVVPAAHEPGASVFFVAFAVGVILMWRLLTGGF